MHLIWDNVKVAKCNCVIQPKKEPIIFQKVRLQFRFCNQKICSVKPFRFHQPNKNFSRQIKDAWYSFFFKIYVIIIQLCDYNQSCHYFSINPHYLILFNLFHLNFEFQYLELRYESRVVRLLGSLSYVIGILMYMGVVLYAPCLALQTITDLPIFGLILLSGITGTVYTVLVSNFIWI